ncbi:MAG: hypothetical protein CL760_12535 [Chloroflexi bacterium]|nr:hypothetical protein [Chloroflexota bacterium]|tara:strand:+ start:19612 stop:19980 length:369 start_codon:yes stop_codon:yes gene_type:complete
MANFTEMNIEQKREYAKSVLHFLNELEANAKIAQGLFTVSGKNIDKLFYNFFKDLKLRSNFFNWVMPQKYSEEEIFEFIEVFDKYKEDIRNAYNGRVRMAKPADEVDHAQHLFVAFNQTFKR